MECKCEKCKSGCSHRPGWFLPGEVAKAAALLGMTEQNFFDTYIGVDWWEAGTPTFVLAPVTTACAPGSEYSTDPRGRCIFFKDGECSIHAAKPNECSFSDHTKTDDECMENRKQIMEAWKDNQGEVERLLGRTPVKPQAGIFDMFSLMDVFRLG